MAEKFNFKKIAGNALKAIGAAGLIAGAGIAGKQVSENYEITPIEHTNKSEVNKVDFEDLQARILHARNEVNTVLKDVKNTFTYDDNEDGVQDGTWEISLVAEFNNRLNVVFDLVKDAKNLKNPNEAYVTKIVVDSVLSRIGNYINFEKLSNFSPNNSFVLVNGEDNTKDFDKNIAFDEDGVLVRKEYKNEITGFTNFYETSMDNGHEEEAEKLISSLAKFGGIESFDFYWDDVNLNDNKSLIQETFNNHREILIELMNYYVKFVHSENFEEKQKAEKIFELLKNGEVSLSTLFDRLVHVSNSDNVKKFFGEIDEKLLREAWESTKYGKNFDLKYPLEYTLEEQVGTKEKKGAYRADLAVVNVIKNL